MHLLYKFLGRLGIFLTNPKRHEDFDWIHVATTSIQVPLNLLIQKCTLKQDRNRVTAQEALKALHVFKSWGSFRQGALQSR